MSDAQRKELSAFLSFLATFDLARPVTTPSDLSDGAALFEVLCLVYVSRISCARHGSLISKVQRWRLLPPVEQAACAAVGQLGPTIQLSEEIIPTHDPVLF